MLTAADAPSCSGNSKFDVYLTCREFSSWGGERRTRGPVRCRSHAQPLVTMDLAAWQLGSPLTLRHTMHLLL